MVSSAGTLRLLLPSRGQLVRALFISCVLTPLLLICSVHFQFDLPGSLLYRRLWRRVEAPQCVRAPALFSLRKILSRAYSAESSRAGAVHKFPLNAAERNRRRIMGPLSMAAVDRNKCAEGTTEQFTGVAGKVTPEPLELDRSRLPFVQRRGCRHYLLLIVVFNNNFYKNVPYLRRLYGAAFARVVFYGDKGNATLGVRPSPLIWGGYRQHVTVAQAMLENPGFDGYWWIGDDVLLNYPFLFATMDMERVWTTRREPNKGTVFPARGKPFAANEHMWLHWNTWYGMQAVQKLYPCLRPTYAARMPAALNCSHCVVYMGSDAGYVPRRFADSFIELVFAFRAVLHEISLPTILRLMVPDVAANLYEDFHNHIYVWEGDKFATIRKLWTPHTAFTHPIKFSAAFPTSRQFAQDKLREAAEVYGLRNGSYGSVDAMPPAVAPS